MYTAPGAANTNVPRETRANKRAITAPYVQSLNSAQQPYFSAVNLCANSCPRNPVPTNTSVSGKMIAKSIGLTPLNRYEIEKLTPSTTQATKREESSLPEIVENFARRGTPRGRSVLIAPLRSERM